VQSKCSPQFLERALKIQWR